MTGFRPILARPLGSTNPGLPSIQSGYVLGRVSGGVGQVELIPINAILDTFRWFTGGARNQVLNSGGPGFAPYWGQSIVSPPGNPPSDVVITAGNDTNTASAASNGGNVKITTGSSTAGTGTKFGGEFRVTTGSQSAVGAGNSGNIIFTTPNSGNSGGNFTVVLGNAGSNAEHGGNVSFTCGNSQTASADGGSFTVQCGTNVNARGGTVHLIPGAQVSNAASNGYVDIQGALGLKGIAAGIGVPTGYNFLYTDTADGHLKAKNSAGTIFDLTGTASGGLTAPNPGTSGGIPYYNTTTSLAASALLAANALVLGGGAGLAPATLASLGTTTTVLHGNAAGAPTFGPVVLTTDVSGILPVANGGTGLASGTSGGIPYYSAAATVASSALLATNALVLGGGAGLAPVTSADWTVASHVLTGGASAGLTVGGLASPGAGFIAANGYYCGSNANAALGITSTNYTALWAPNGTGVTRGVFLGNAADPANYYRNTMHSVGNIDGSVAWLTASAAGVAFIGTNTNNNAASGNVGEEVKSNVTTPASITTATATNVTSISLTAGDWEVSGVISFIGAGTTVITDVFANITQTSLSTSQANLDTDSFVRLTHTFTTGSNPTIAPASTRMSLAANTTIYLVGFVQFNTSTCTTICKLRARRVR